MFLELVRRAADDDPVLAVRALRGLAMYQAAQRGVAATERAAIATVLGASLRQCAGAGPPIVLVPSLINPASIVDLDPEVSLAGALSGLGTVLLVDWGCAARRRDFDLTAHVEQLLLPLLEALGKPAALVGYCLGGTLALAAANRTAVRAVATLAAPWNFGGYPARSREEVLTWWEVSQAGAEPLGVLPIESLQTAFWSLDPASIVAKFARFADLAPGSPEARRFVQVEDWANDGEPLPLPAARELVEDLFGADLPGRGLWRVGGRAVNETAVPSLHFTASNDRIVPAATAAPGERRCCRAGHVGMVVGRTAPEQLHAPLREWLARTCRPP